METTKNPSTAASRWAAPSAALQGTGLSFAGYPTAHINGSGTNGSGTNGSGTDQMTAHSAKTLAAVRKDDPRVLDPRRRKR